MVSAASAVKQHQLIARPEPQHATDIARLVAPQHNVRILAQGNRTEQTRRGHGFSIEQ